MVVFSSYYTDANEKIKSAPVEWIQHILGHERRMPMKTPTMYIPNPTPALEAARIRLRRQGVVFPDTAQEAEYLLYPIPTKLEMLHECTTDQTVIGGGLDFLNDSIARIDLMEDPDYLCANAAITAQAALAMVLERLSREISQANILILGWGRIGKCLTHQLDHLNAHVTVYARKEADRAMLACLGYHSADRQTLSRILGRFHCIINTVPAPILSEEESRTLRPGCLKLELASGVWLPGDDVLVAHGLPGKCKSDASGELIAKRIIHHLGGMP